MSKLFGVVSVFLPTQWIGDDLTTDPVQSSFIPHDMIVLLILVALPVTPHFDNPLTEAVKYRRRK
ncbi:MAG: hypothetical protein OXG60_01945 [Chloroflexi bacterium]|nr:hypothetical protein [Chloroflexota bacterium]